MFKYFVIKALAYDIYRYLNTGIPAGASRNQNAFRVILLSCLKAIE